MLRIKRQHNRQMKSIAVVELSQLRMTSGLTDEIDAVNVRIGNNGQLLDLLSAVGRIFYTGIMRRGFDDGSWQRGETARLNARSHEPHHHPRHGGRRHIEGERGPSGKAKCGEQQGSTALHVFHD